MFQSYFKTAWRNLWRNNTYSLIKILGLSIGLTVCMLIFLFTKDELSYDQFHKNKIQIYRVIQTWQNGNQPAKVIGITNAVLGKAFLKEIPEVQQFVHVNGTPVTVKKNNDVLIENPVEGDLHNPFLKLAIKPALEGSMPALS